MGFYFLVVVFIMIYYALGFSLNMWLFKEEGLLLFCPFGMFPPLSYLYSCFVRKDGFEGWYFKNQKDDVTLALIPGRSKDEAFIQVITQDRSYNVIYPRSDFRKGNEDDDEIVQIDKNHFSKKGIKIDIHSEENSLDLKGVLYYKHTTPIRYNIMGPFKYFPMECRHDILSMHHYIEGTLTLNGQAVDFGNGNGYLESDRGTSFPEHYTWVQCNDLEMDNHPFVSGEANINSSSEFSPSSSSPSRSHSPCTVMASIALIPFLGMRFWGCICVVRYGGREHRLATYLGASVVCRTRCRLELRQRSMRLCVDVPEHAGHKLQAPANGSMVRTIHESACTRARFQFWKGSKSVFDRESAHASFEFVE